MNEWFLLYIIIYFVEEQQVSIIHVWVQSTRVYKFHANNNNILNT